MKARALIRPCARLGIAGVVLTLVVLVTVQYARIIERNVAYAHQVADVRGDIESLQHKREEQLRTIRRLNDPRGALPEIHDRLHLVGDHEAIIYLKRPGGDPASPADPAL